MILQVSDRVELALRERAAEVLLKKCDVRHRLWPADKEGAWCRDVVFGAVVFRKKKLKFPEI